VANPQCCGVRQLRLAISCRLRLIALASLDVTRTASLEGLVTRTHLYLR